MGSHGRKGLARFLMGSVAEGVVRHAPCSVEIAKFASAVAGDPQAADVLASAQ